MLSSGTPRRRRPTTLSPRTRARSPCTTTNGGTRRSHAAAAATNALSPTRTYCATPLRPPKVAQSSTTAWPASCTPLAKHAVRADGRVVRGVRAHHEEVVRADARGAALGAAVHRRVLAEDVVLADLEAPGAARVALGLRLAADDRERVHARCPRPRTRRSANDRVRMEHAPRAEDHAGLDDRVRTDHRRPARARRGDRRWPSGARSALRGPSLTVTARGRRRSRGARRSRTASRRRRPRRGTSTRSCGGAPPCTSRSRRSPGVTGRRNFALSMPRKYISEFDASNGSLAYARMPPICASASMMSTPGMMGRAGKCP